MSKETKREKFTRLAENRTNKILKDFELLGNCSNKSNYEYDMKDVRKIFNVIEKKLKETKARYKIEEETPRFKL